MKQTRYWLPTYEAVGLNVHQYSPLTKVYIEKLNSDQLVIAVENIFYNII